MDDGIVGLILGTLGGLALGLLAGTMMGAAGQNDEWKQCVEVCEDRPVQHLDGKFCLCGDEWEPRR